MTHPALAPGRTAVITGGASGVGLAAAGRLASMGLNICLADRNADALKRAKALLGTDRVITGTVDVSRFDDMVRLQQSAAAAFGGNRGRTPGGLRFLSGPDAAEYDSLRSCRRQPTFLA